MEKVNNLCKDCRNWQLFKKGCFFYWDHKKECSNHTRSEGGLPSFKKVEFNE